MNYFMLYFFSDTDNPLGLTIDDTFFNYILADLSIIIYCVNRDSDEFPISVKSTKLLFPLSSYSIDLFIIDSTIFF